MSALEVRGAGQQERSFFVYRANLNIKKGINMAIIIRSNGQTRDQGEKRKQLYTWVGCGLVIVLTLVSVMSNMGGEERPDYSKFSSSKMQDLAALPFGSDAEAGSFLRGNSEYAAISNADLLGSLFSSEDRKERQAKDKADGVPPPPDPEYREIAKQKAKDEEAQRIKEARMQKLSQDREAYKQEAERVKQKEKEKVSKITKNKKGAQDVRNQNTSPKTLSTGGKSSVSGGSSGVTGSIWRYEGKDIKGASSAIASHAATAQDVAFARERGRQVGLDVAAIESMKGANADSADSAAAGAIDAFQGEIAAEDLDKDEQELGLEELPQGLDEDLQDELKRTIGDDLNKQASNTNSSDTANGNNYDINDNCLDTNGEIVTSCIWSKLITKGIDLGFSLLTTWLTGLIT